MGLNISKRMFLKSTLSSAALLTAPVSSGLPARDAESVFMFDSRFLVSKKLAKIAHQEGSRCIDLVDEEATFWRNTRSGFAVAVGTPVNGVCQYADWLAIRGALEPLGWRIKREDSLRELVAAELDGASLYSWAMK